MIEFILTNVKSSTDEFFSIFMQYRTTNDRFLFSKAMGVVLMNERRLFVFVVVISNGCLSFHNDCLFQKAIVCIVERSHRGAVYDLEKLWNVYRLTMSISSMQRPKSIARRRMFVPYYSRVRQRAPKE